MLELKLLVMLWTC